MKLGNVWTGLLVGLIAFGSVGSAFAAPPSSLPQAPAVDRAAECLDEAMDRMGISLSMETDPALLRDVLQKDMFLNDLPSIKSLLADQMSQPQSLRPMLERVRLSILEKHPAISEFVCSALEKNLIEKASSRPMILRTIHHMFLLETIISAMYHDWTLMVDVGNHFARKRQELGARADFIGSAIDIGRATGDLFFVAKAKTIDGVFKRFQTIRGNNYLAESEAAGSKLCLVLNITEAVVTDNLQGHRNNALVGIGLSLNPLESVALEGEERILRYYLSQEWTSLYETWNLAFITGKMDNLHLLYPKLLIPSVIDAPSNDYLFNRSLALWTGINFYLLNKLAKASVVHLPKAKELSLLWGEINLKYAKAYVWEENNVDLESFRGRLRTGIVNSATEIFNIIRNPFLGVPRVCI